MIGPGAPGISGVQGLLGQERGGRGGTQPRSLPVPGTQARGLVAVGEVTEALWGISLVRPQVQSSDPVCPPLIPLCSRGVWRVDPASCSSQRKHQSS